MKVFTARYRNTTTYKKSAKQNTNVNKIVNNDLVHYMWNYALI